MFHRVVFSGLARGAGAAFGFGLSVIIGRRLGPIGAGHFFLGMTVMTLLSQVTRFGYPYHLLRHGSVYWTRAELTRLRGLYVRSLVTPLVLSLAAGGLMWILSGWLAADVFRKPELESVFRGFAVALVPFTTLWINAGLFKSIKMPEVANLTEAGFLPFAVVILLLLLGVRDADGSAIAYLAAASAVALATTLAAIRKLTRRKGTATSGGSVPNGLSYGFATTVVAVCNYLILWAPFILLGRVADGAVAGAYSAAQRTVMLLSLVNVVVNSVYLPVFSTAHAVRDPKTLRRTYRVSTAIMVAGTAPLGLIVFAMPQTVLGIFGAGFETGAVALQVLVVGYVVSMLFGPADEMMLMFGDTRELRTIAFVVLGAEAILAVLLIPPGQAVAAAAITGGAFVARRLLAAWCVRRTIARLDIVAAAEGVGA